MAEEVKDEVVEEENEQASTQEETETTEKTFTQAELEDIVRKEKAKAKRSAEREYKEKMDEAEKLRKMNAEQKAEYEAQKQADRIAELEAQLNRNGLEKEASKMLSEAGIVASDDILNFVVKDDAEGTQEAVSALSSLVNELADKKVGEMLKGKTPKKVEQSTSGVITKEQFNKMGYKDRNELLQNNPELYHQLKG
ncbi:DUF4355 domain-containing protein [Streptococcus macedonicus]|uniref:DUF4355 domain-containing protein n=1 Tax=Streptococcus macedonicus TaxID=59310 RepID=A0A1C3SR99_STRMC|nr:DUF4355 domain-containing protein [Streptococcus macedonicus]PHV57660.1 DUF4355 domain-containing protein [Streptococcus macedonicus]PHV58239.1 DUF4355 domain-containing protein [Streptococcus macedonicus]SCA90028.1 Phage capsid and scaffold [Streptococcus macedonicus]